MKNDTYNDVPIKTLEIQLVQSPLADNGNRTICSAHLELADGRKFTDLGEAVSGDNRIVAASESARERVMAQVANARHAPLQPSDESSLCVPATSKPDAAARANANGGGTKPISPKQIGLITSLCQQQGHDADAMTHAQFGKNLESLQGTEANMLIKTLTGKIND